MTYSEITIALQRFAQLFLTNRLEDITKAAALPFAFHSPDGSKIMTDPQEILAAFTCFLDQVRRAGVRNMIPRVIEIEERSELRCIFLASWQFYLENGELLSTSQARYVVRRCDTIAVFKFEMVEYLDISFPGVVDEVLCAS